MSCSTYSWTIAEYVLRCCDADNLAEILTEGALDRDVFAQATSRWSLSDVTVLDASYVQPEPGDLERNGLSPGVRANLVAVASALEKQAQDSAVTGRLAVVVDRDYDPPSCGSRFLFQTDGYSLESYVLSRDVLDCLVTVGLGRSHRPAGMSDVSEVPNTCSGTEIYERVIGAAIQAAALRLSLRQMQPSLAPFERWIRRVVVEDSDGWAALDGSTLLAHVLEGAARSSELASAEEARQAAEVLVSDDAFALVRGHDFLQILAKVFRSPWGRRVTGGAYKDWTEPRISRALFLALGAGIDEQPLFQAVRSRVSPPEPT